MNPMNPPTNSTLLKLLAVCLAGLFPIQLASAKDKADAKAALLEAVKSDLKSYADFEKAAEKARTNGAPALAVAEAELFYCVQSDTNEPLVRILADLEKVSANWSDADSLFSERAETIGFIHFARALLAASAGDATAFENEMKEAFWANPAAASLFADKLSTLREKQRLAKLTVPLDVAMQTSDGKTITLGELAKDQKALLLDFWASWCGPCMSLMDELSQRGKKLAPAEVRVVGINTESSREKAEKVRREKKMLIPWLIEPDDCPYTKLLKIDRIPRAVLLSPEGRVLFNGHPSDPALLAALSRLGVSDAVTKLAQK